MAASQRAVLIGIRSYPNIDSSVGTDLRACHNDVVLMADLLEPRGFELEILVDRMPEKCDCRYCQGPPDAVILPTRDNIRAAVRKMTDAVTSDDLALLYFSGHGSEVTNVSLSKGTETEGHFPGQRFQTFVPYDSGRRGKPNRDIADREVAQWIRRLNEKTPNVTFIFDSCYSGGIGDLRSGTATGENARMIEADDRPPEEKYEGGKLDDVTQAALDELSDFKDASGGGYGSDSTSRAASGWVWAPGRSAIILSGCGAHETSTETHVDGVYHGLFTYALVTTVQAAEDNAAEGQDDKKLWSQVFPEISKRVTREKLTQHPRREGDGPILEVGPIDPSSVEPPDFVELRRFAVVIGIDYQYKKVGQDDAISSPELSRFPELQAPADDAVAVAEALEKYQGYEIVGLSSKESGPLLNEKATRENILNVLQRLARIKVWLFPESSVVIYFAGHGQVVNDDKEGSVGYLIPWDGDRNESETWIPMPALRDQLIRGIYDKEKLAALGRKERLDRLKAKHLLLTLDCCFGGAMSLGFFRGEGNEERPIYYSEYKRYVDGIAWQLLTSASYNQQAMDRDPRDPSTKHSPFAEAFLDGISTADADGARSGGREDRIITAPELQQLIDDRLRRAGVDIQTPKLMPLRTLVGEFIFFVPGFRPIPAPDPPLDPKACPWHDDALKDEDLFFGREMATLELLARFMLAGRPFAVTGSSGSGRTSLLQAGLLPMLRDPKAGREQAKRWARSILDIRAADAKEINGVINLMLAQAARAGLLDPLVEDRLVQKEVVDRLRTTGLCADRRERNDTVLVLLRERAEAFTAMVKDLAEKSGFLNQTQSGADRLQTQQQMEKFGLEAPAEKQIPEWANRLRIRTLLNDPARFTQRILLACGLSEYMEGDDSPWNVSVDVELLKAETVPKRTVLYVDSKNKLTKPIKSRQDNGLRVIGTAFEAPKCTDDVPWEEYKVPLPTLEELREMTTGPAAANILYFDPPEIIDELIADAAQAKVRQSALPLLLKEVYITAWKRRGNRDRQMNGDDVGMVGGLSQLLARNAGKVYDDLDKELQASSLNLLALRLVEWEAPDHPKARCLHWHELDEVTTPGKLEAISKIDGPDAPWAKKRFQELKRIKDTVLPEFAKSRALLVNDHEAELSHRGLPWVWQKLLQGAKSPERGHRLQWFSLNAFDWHNSQHKREKLVHYDDDLKALAMEPELLCRVEWQFLQACRHEHLMLMMRRLTAEAFDPQTGWSRSALLAIRALQTGVEAGEKLDGGRLFEAKQALRRVLDNTPLSVPINLAEPIEGLAFLDGGKVLGVRLESTQKTRAWRLDDFRELNEEEVAQLEPIAKDAGKGRKEFFHSHLEAISEWNYPFQESIFGIKARASLDRTIRYLPADAPMVGLSGFDNASIPLYGLDEVASFLTFAHPAESTLFPVKGEWLAAASSSARGSEIRLWKVLDMTRWGLPSEPVTLDVLPRQTEVAHTAQVDLAFLADGSLLADVGEQTFRLWDMKPAIPVAQAWFPTGAPSAIVSGGIGWLMVRTDTELALSRAPNAEPSHRVALLANDRVLAVSFDGKKGVLWRQEEKRLFVWSGDEVFRPAMPEDWDNAHVLAPVFSPDGQCLAIQVVHPPDKAANASTEAELGPILLWKTEDFAAAPRQLSPEKDEARQAVQELRFSADGQWLAAVAPSHDVWLWQNKEGAEPRLLPSSTSLAFGHDKKRQLMALGTDQAAEPVVTEPDPRLSLQARHQPAPEPNQQDRVEKIKGPPGHVTLVAFSPDGQYWAAGMLGGGVLLGHVRQKGERPRQSKRPRHRRHGPQRAQTLHCRRGEILEVESLAFDSDGRRLAIARRTPGVPYRHQVDVYRLDTKELLVLVEGCAGRKLHAGDLPPELKPAVLGVDRHEPAPEKLEESVPSREFLVALGLCEPEAVD